jgi:succinate dehydrogenase / fumarate reductase cytochrome b subunit
LVSSVAETTDPLGVARKGVADSVLSFWDRNHFALRRLHSLSGIIPVGVFLLNHLLANSTAFLGAKNFDHHIGIIHDLPWLLAIETVFIFIPLAFHAIYGLVIAWQGKMNQGQYAYVDNWRYTLQRVTAYVTLAFVLIHLAHFRFAYLFGGEEYGSAYPTFFSFTREGFHAMWLPVSAWIVIYVIGTTAAIFHFCNGIVTFCITWGLTAGVAARRKVLVATSALAVVLFLWGMVSLVALGRTDVTTQPAAGHSAVVSAQQFGLPRAGP